VIHSWWIPELGGKIQAIPGRTNHIWFKADKQGTYVGQCAELCGLYHEAMKASVVVTDEAAYRSFISGGATAGLGKAEFEGVCATCHGMHGEGGYGPALATNTLITQPAGLIPLLRNGRGKMPAVGDTWTPAQLAALVAYTKAHVYTGASSGG
jgi:cytochrome c oxidase subunit II